MDYDINKHGVEGRQWDKFIPKCCLQCRNCGYVHKGKKAPNACPACNHAQAYFEEKKNNY